MEIVLLWIAILTVVWILIALGLQAMRKPYVTGKEDIVNSLGVAQTDLAPEGKVFVDGTLWNAVSDEGNIQAGADVVIVEVTKLRIRVRKA